MKEGSITDQVGPYSNVSFAGILLSSAQLRHRPIFIMELSLEAASWSSLDGSTSWSLIRLAIAIARLRFTVFNQVLVKSFGPLEFVN